MKLRFGQILCKSDFPSPAQCNFFHVSKNLTLFYDQIGVLVLCLPYFAHISNVLHLIGTSYLLEGMKCHPPLAFLAPKVSTHHIFIWTLPKLTWTSLMSEPFGTYDHMLHCSMFSSEIFMFLVATSI